MDKEQEIQIEKIIGEGMKLMQHHFGRIMLKMVNNMNEVLVGSDKRSKEKRK